MSDTMEEPAKIVDIFRGAQPRIALNKIIVLADRGRKEYTGIIELADSIRRLGLAHPPVLRPSEDDAEKMILVAGGRRYRALCTLGVAEVPYTLLADLNPQEAKELELEENLKRSGLAWTEEVELMRQIDELKRTNAGKIIDPKTGKAMKWNLAKTAESIGSNFSTVQKQVKFANDLRARPDLKEKLAHLPLTVAMREHEKLLEGEKLDAQHKSGEIKVQASMREGDAVTVVKSLPSNAVDLWLSDPPFGIPELAEAQGESRGSTQSYQGLMKEADNLTKDQVVALMADLIPEVYRVLKPGANFYLFFGFDIYADLLRLLLSAGFTVDPTPIIWDKGRSTAPHRGYNYMPCYEPVLHGFKGPIPRRLAEPSKKIVSFAPLHAKDKSHAFQKPLDLLAFFIKQSTQLGEVVLDTFAGSGSVSIASLQVGRQTVGVELNHEHWLVAQGRVNEELALKAKAS